MRITEALEKGYSRLTMKGVRSDVYAFIDGDGVFKWNHTNTPVRAKLLIQDWFPFSPEPEKCEACREETFMSESDPSYKAYYTAEMRHHLRKYHCQCKKEAP